jgi:hypothetical protein
MSVTKEEAMRRSVALVGVLLIALSIALCMTTNPIAFTIAAGLISIVVIIIILYAVMSI